MAMHNPPHPGNVLREYMGDDLTITDLAAHMDVARGNLSGVVNGRQSITPAIALRLAECFPKTMPEFWLGMQNGYDLAQLRKVKRRTLKPVLAGGAQ